ncbi:GNAT family N-acetyltransferase [Mesorhizobium xinjiangense]|uniref:GNAT family N-acetyltransferase n=1 Tax=Mesorhizobium xinjiangense TaxID=2678685 RepID=UPI0012EDB8D4|nr:GNAT family N-acetyltransferase [Mesorhizobium xinjiangense]
MFLRTAGEADLAAVRALLVETWHDTYDAIYGREKVTAITDEWHSLPALRAQLTAPNSEFVVADDGTRLAGLAFAVAAEDGKTVRLRQLYVRPGFQGKGTGGLLFEEIVDSFPEARRIELEVEEANRRAVAFYEALGFQRVGNTANCGCQGSGIPALVYAKTVR